MRLLFFGCDKILGSDKAVFQRCHRNGWTIIGIVNVNQSHIEDAIAQQRCVLEKFPHVFRVYLCSNPDRQTAYRVMRNSWSRVERGKFDSFWKPDKGMIHLAIADFIMSGMSPDSTYLMTGNTAIDQQCAAAAKINFLWSNQWQMTNDK